MFADKLNDKRVSYLCVYRFSEVMRLWKGGAIIESNSPQTSSLSVINAVASKDDKVQPGNSKNNSTMGCKLQTEQRVFL